MMNIRVNGAVIKKASKVRLRRIVDGVLFEISSACVLKLPEELVHVVGQPQEELDTSVWDISQKFEVLEEDPTSKEDKNKPAEP